MGASESKLRCLYLPAQSGKTRKSEELITAVRGANPKSIDIWISANNKLLVYQTTSRLTKDLGLSTEFSDAVIKGKLFSWTSGTKATNIPYEKLAERCLSGEIEAILVCAHRARLNYLAELLETLSLDPSFDKEINIWIDEADKSCKMWISCAPCLDLPIVKSVTLVSATFTEVFKRFDSIAVIPYMDTSPVPYRRLKDAVQVSVDIPFTGHISFMEAILNAYPKLSEPGQRAFIPGSVFRKCHEGISENLLSRGFAVLLLNGTHKEIRLPNDVVIPLKPYLLVKDPFAIPDEFNLTLARLYKKYKLERFPLAITGFLCVERGVTFQIDASGEHDGFLFDYTILGAMKNTCEAYQSVARVFGNVGAFKGYKPVTVYTTPKMFTVIKEQEETACHVAKLVHLEGLETVDQSVLHRAASYAEDQKWKLTLTECATFGLAKEFIKAKGGRAPPLPTLEVDGFYRCSFRGYARAILSYDVVTAAIRGWSKTAYFELEEGRTFYSRLHICYKDVKDPDSVIFLVRALERKKRLVRK
jgi:hypothetical protein